MIRHYRLDNERRVVACDFNMFEGDDWKEKFLAWVAWFEDPHNVIVGRSEPGPGIEVCTDFLGIDTRPLRYSDDKAPPLVFETAVFIRRGDEEPGSRGECVVIGRCSTWEQAEEMHAATVAEYERTGRG